MAKNNTATVKGKKKKTKKEPKNKVKRKYDGADAYMLEKSEELQTRFGLDVADFTAKDSTLNAAYATDWLARITAAQNATTDHIVVAQQKGKTITVKQAMQACSDAYTDIIFFANKTFKTEPAKLQEFGRGTDYEKARKSQAHMLTFMKVLIKTTDKYKTQLLAKGCPQATIDALATALTQLDSTNTDQNLTIHERPELSADRIKLLNAAYAPMAEVIIAARLVYKTNAAKLGEYRYHPPVHHRNMVEIEFDAPAGVITNLDISGLKDLTVLNVQFKATGSTFVIYGGTAPDSEPGVIIIEIPAGETIQKTLAEIMALLPPGDPPGYANTKNTGTSTGHLKIVFNLEKKKK